MKSYGPREMRDQMALTLALLLFGLTFVLLDWDRGRSASVVAADSPVERFAPADYCGPTTAPIPGATADPVDQLIDEYLAAHC